MQVHGQQSSSAPMHPATQSAPETSKSSQLLLPWQRQREDLPAFDVLICLKHAKCHWEDGELCGEAPGCPDNGGLSTKGG